MSAQRGERDASSHEDAVTHSDNNLNHYERCPLNGYMDWSNYIPGIKTPSPASPSFEDTAWDECLSKDHKKKQGSHNEEDRIEIEEEDLFATPTELETPVKLDLAASAPGSQAAKLIESRAKYFRETKEELMKHPTYKHFVDLQARNSDISRLVNPNNNGATFKPSKLKHAPSRGKLSRLITWAGTRADLLEVVDILRVYRAKQWFVDDLNRLDFIGRCRTLKAPDIALAVLYHRPKFGIDIPSLSSARALMHSLLVTPYPPPNAEEAPLPDDLALPTSTPFTHALLLANLFDLYALPPAETDQVARALLLGECVRQFDKGEDLEDANTIVQKVREWAESQQTPADVGGVVLNRRDPRVKDGKLIATSAAIKARGKAAPGAVPKDSSSYEGNLTRDELAWVRPRLEKFIQWAEKEGQDASWVEKLKGAA